MPGNASDLRVELETKAMDAGVDLFGVADITCLHDYLCAKGGEFLRDFPRAISVGIGFPNGAVDQLVQHHTLSSQWTWRYHVEWVNSALDRVVMALGGALEDAGYRSHLMYRYEINDNKGRWAYPLKLTGYLAGLGWIGKNSLLINPQFGPRFRLSVVFTDAPLILDSPLPVRCGTCNDCIDICPPKALSVGISFDPSQPREDWSHAKACNAYVIQRAIDLPFPDRKAACGLCVYVCPFGKRKKKGPREKEEVEHVKEEVEQV